MNRGTIAADGPTGSTFTINVGTSCAAAGFFINQGQIDVDAGNTLAIVVGPRSEVFRPGGIIDNGGSLLITTIGSNQIVGGYAPVSG